QSNICLTGWFTIRIPSAAGLIDWRLSPLLFGLTEATSNAGFELVCAIKRDAPTPLRAREVTTTRTPFMKVSSLLVITILHSSYTDVVTTNFHQTYNPMDRELFPDENVMDHDPSCSPYTRRRNCEAQCIDEWSTALVSCIARLTELRHLTLTNTQAVD